MRASAGLRLPGALCVALLCGACTPGTGPEVRGAPGAVGDADRSATLHPDEALPPGTPAAPGATGEGGPGTPAPAAPPASAEDVAATVEHLIETVAVSELTFVRNDRDHSGSEAAAHLREKHETFQRDVRTPEDFITKVASISLLTGKPYLVKYPDGTRQPLADWLTARLQEHRAAVTPPAR
jgi:hypothetical protein